MKALLIALLLVSCGYKRFEVERAKVDRKTDVAMRLESLGWDIEVSNSRKVATEWHRLRLRHSALYVTEVQMRIIANLRRGTVVGLCTQRIIRADGAREIWWFRPCTDVRALRIVSAALEACGKETL